MSGGEARRVQSARRDFGQALASALRKRGITQARLAAALDGMAQSAVSTWTTGEAVPTHAMVFRIERILDLTPGYLSRHLGYLPVGTTPPSSVLDAIAADPLLSDIHRQALTALYREFTTRQ